MLALYVRVVNSSVTACVRLSVLTAIKAPVPVSEMCPNLVWTFHANVNCVLSVAAQLVWTHWLASACESGTTL